MSDDLKATIEELRRLDKEATEGPWRVGQPHFFCSIDHGRGTGGHGRGDCFYSFQSWHADGYSGSFIYVDHEYIGHAQGAESEPGMVAGQWSYEYGGVFAAGDAALIAAMRNALPGLLDAAELYDDLAEKHVRLCSEGDQTVTLLAEENTRLRARLERVEGMVSSAFDEGHEDGWHSCDEGHAESSVRADWDESDAKSALKVLNPRAPGEDNPNPNDWCPGCGKIQPLPDCSAKGVADE